MLINNYLRQVKTIYNRGNSTEHSYRAEVQTLLNSLVKGITVTNEPKRQKCGAPDYIIQKKEVPLGYIEAKDVGTNLDKAEKSEQIERYLKSLDNLILTDYLEFRFYKYGEKVKKIKIASVENGKMKFHLENFSILETHLKDFCDFKGQTIKSIEKLAQMMAQKARMMEEVIFNAVKEEYDNNSLKDQLNGFRRILIHDLGEKTFADIYAQTIVYGLFAARLHDETLEDFSRQEARGLIPHSNPFLRNLFDYISGAQLDDRVIWIVDDLCEIFRATDLQTLLADFGKSTGQADSFLHFYETFLDEYDPELRKSRGVYYTPEPAVNFIVKAVDDILQNEFGLSQGIADTSKVTIKQDSGTIKKNGKIVYEDVEVHKVQILDPAVGTGTFLAETIKQIYNKNKGQKGIWSGYVEEHLIPRLNGFEILMAPYTICHSKLEMFLKETGYKPKDKKKQNRFRVFLTNSLEEANLDTETLFMKWLSNEATEANYIKKDTPVMVVIGNPPYANFGQMNKGDWIHDLIAVYKKNLNEKKINIDDDYIKFIRYGEYLIDKNGGGVLAYISNNSFIDGVTHRQMRKHLLQTFDKIYILDLHGNVRKREICPDGSKDENVFNIMQGVSINIFIKKSKSEKLGNVFHYDMYGRRQKKYDFLYGNSIQSINWNELDYKEPYYFFVPKDFAGENKYNKGFLLTHLYLKHSAGIKTKVDHIAVDFDKKILIKRVQDIISNKLTHKQIRQKYGLSERTTWEFNPNNIKSFNTNKIFCYEYRPFDKRYTYYDREFLSRNRRQIMDNFFNKINIAIETSRNGDYVFIGNSISDEHYVSDNSFKFPLYLYPDKEEQNLLGDSHAERNPNLNPDIVNQIAEKLALTFTLEKEETESTFAPIDILDYIYAVLHSPTYREKYKEFLKIDFPRVPYPENKETFWELVKLGEELRTIHLLENPIVEKYITTYPIDGNNEVEKPHYKDKKVYINKEQYFEAVPEVAWNFYIGGYQPAQKWLKDRKGRTLSVDDILHYQKIIVALVETDKIMREIDQLRWFSN